MGVTNVPFYRRISIIGLVLALVAALALLAGPPGRAAAASTLLSQGKTATASSTESAAYPASDAVDGNTGTRWSSAFSDPQWLEVDLGSSASITQVVLQWETAYATAFQSRRPATHELDHDLLHHHRHRRHPDPQRDRHRPVRPHVRHRPRHRPTATRCGNSRSTASLASGTCSTTDAALNQPATASSAWVAPTFPASNAVDGNTGTRWSSAFSDPQWLEVDLVSSARPSAR